MKYISHVVQIRFFASIQIRSIYLYIRNAYTVHVLITILTATASVNESEVSGSRLFQDWIMDNVMQSTK